VSGRYRASDGDFEVELRVDVDGPRATKRVSADYFKTGGAPTAYIGSMRVDEPLISITPARVEISGAGVFTWPAKHTFVRIAIPRVAESAAPAPATLRHLTSPGPVRSEYVCAFESQRFRTVQYEEAREKSVVQLVSYDTGSLPSGGTARALSPVSAYAEAGIELREERQTTVIDSSTAGANAAWSDAELHAAMEAGFSRWADIPQWAIWLLNAVTHEDPEIFGLMFDRKGLPRQGCAIFYHELTPTPARIARELIHVSVHELGHGFNLPHCWQRSNDAPPSPSRPGAKSWMNYPERFPGGPAEYWRKFAFEFDDVELVQLRHGFRDRVIMGGEPFAGSAARARSGSWDSEQQDEGLRLTLRAPQALAQGVPVTVGLELSLTGTGTRWVPGVLGPRAGSIDIAILDARGNESVFEPLLLHCRGEKLVPLRPGDAPIQDYAFIHYGRSGFAFADPGLYRMRARYDGRDGSVALSDEVPIRVQAPVSRAGRDVVNLVAGNKEVGALMSLMGSDAPGLRGGNETLSAIIERYPTHPLADVARVVQGVNLARGFKRMESGGKINVRPPDLVQAAALVGRVIDVSVLPAPGNIATRNKVASSVNAFVNSRGIEVGRALPTLAPQRGRIPGQSRLAPQGRRKPPRTDVRRSAESDTGQVTTSD
jgi:hypothetical protein